MGVFAAKTLSSKRFSFNTPYPFQQWQLEISYSLAWQNSYKVLTFCTHARVTKRVAFYWTEEQNRLHMIYEWNV